MGLNFIHFTISIACFYSVVAQTQGYVQCGSKLCHGNTAQCCTWDENECCWLSWYTLWWIWVGAIILMAVLFSMLACCLSKRRRSASVRHLVVVPPHDANHVGRYYGSIGSAATVQQSQYAFYPVHSQSYNQIPATYNAEKQHL